MFLSEGKKEKVKLTVCIPCLHVRERKYISTHFNLGTRVGSGQLHALSALPVVNVPP